MSTASSGQQVTDSINGKLTFEQDKNRIVGRDENNLIRLLILANGTDFAMKVAKDGYDATTATNDQLVFNSEQNVFKIVSKGTATIGAVGASAIGSTTITHGLGYIPAVLAYQTDGTNYFTVPFTSFVSGGANDGKMSLNVYVIANSTQVTFYAVTSSFGSTSGLTFSYYLMQESAN